METSKLAAEVVRTLDEAEKNKKAWGTFERWAFATLGESRSGRMERHEWMKQLLDVTWSRVMRPEELEEKLRTERLTGQSEGYNSGFKDGRNSGGLTRGEFDILRKLINNIGFEVEIGTNSIAIRPLKDMPVTVASPGVDERRAIAEFVLYSLGWTYDEVLRQWKRPEEQVIGNTQYIGEFKPGAVFHGTKTMDKRPKHGDFKPVSVGNADPQTAVVLKTEWDFLVQFKDRTIENDGREREMLRKLGWFFDYGDFGDGPPVLRSVSDPKVFIR